MEIPIDELSKLSPYAINIIKWSVVITMVGYTIFSAMVLRQVKLMSETVKVGFETPIQIVAIGQLLFGLVILVIALLI